MRGLKLKHRAAILGDSESHPTGVRGLKYVRLQHEGTHGVSHPTGVRGLKYSPPVQNRLTSLSHPTGVRGLKLDFFVRFERVKVAPHWGAWIEIVSSSGLRVMV